MGIFANRCEALIDPATGMALKGEALEQARQVRKAPRCGFRVKRGAKFCGKCGSGAPGGSFRCAACKKWIPAEAQFCPYCSSRLHPETRMDMAGGIWEKRPDVFAQRFEVGNIQELVKRDSLLVQEGTMALLLDAGRFSKELPAGQHHPQGLLRTINWFGHPPPRSFVMVDAGDVRLSLVVDDLRSAEMIPLTFAGDVVIRLNPKRADDFLANGIKGGQAMTYDELMDLLEGEIRFAVENFCHKSTMEDLAFDPERRKRLLVEVEATLKTACERLGIEVVYVATADFQGEGYRKLLEKQGELTLKRQEVEYDAAMRVLLDQDKMSTFKGEQELKDYMDALAQEFRVTGARREREEMLLLRGWERQDELEAMAHEFEKEEREAQQAYRLTREKMAFELEQTVHEIKKNTLRSEEDNRLWLQRHEQTLREKRDMHDEEVRQTGDWLKIKQEKNRIKAEQKAVDAARREKMSPLQMIADIEDAGARDAALRVISQQAQAGQSPEQMLAAAAATSPAAAQALAEVMKAKVDDREQWKQEIQSIMQEANGRTDKMMEKMLDTVAKMGAGGGQPQTVVNKYQ